MKVVFGLNQKQNLYKILIYTANLFDEKEIEHSKLIYQFLDKKKQSYRSENFDQLIYMLHPFEGPYTFDFEEQHHETFKLLYGKAKEYEATLALVKGENRPNILRLRPDFQNEKRCYDVDKVELLSPDRGHSVTDVFSLYFSALYTAYAY